MRTLKIKYRQFACDKCGAIHSIQTNHKGKVYNQKCKNWPCTSGCFDYTTMSYWGGKTEIKETRFIKPPDYKNKVKLLFKKG